MEIILVVSLIALNHTPFNCDKSHKFTILAKNAVEKEVKMKTVRVQQNIARKNI